MSNTTEMLDLYMIGDKLATVARQLGILPRAMATSQVPLIEQIFPGIDNLECTRCIMTSKRQVLYTAAKRDGVARVSLEKDSAESAYWSGFNPSEMKEDLEERGFATDIVDFSRGIHHGIRQVGAVYGREKRAERLIRRYDAVLAEAMEILPDCTGMCVVTLLGMINPYDGSHHLIVEGPDGYLDRNILKPMGCENRGDLLCRDGGGVIHDLSPLKEARPDVIVVTGDAQVVLAAIHWHVKKDPEFLKIPAIENHAVFALPHCSGGDPVDYPRALHAWAKAFLR